MRLGISALAMGLCLTLSASMARSDSGKCARTQHKYNSIVHAISHALRGYANCVSDSKGEDDCSAEFTTLKSAQDDFE